MVIISKDNNIIIESQKDFVLSHILECGQCFRFEKLDEEEYIIVAKGKMLHIKQDNDVVTLFDTTMEEFDNIWKQYFDLDTDYSQIKEVLIARNNTMQEVVGFQSGIRILNQDFNETLISFIISQNQQIPRIKKIIATICERYGDIVGEYNGKKYYSFPDTLTLSRITEEEFRECKAGFRAAYLCGAANALYKGELTEKELKKMTREEARIKLTALKGVGNKVADCTLLFGLGFREAFPVDVWIQRIMQERYFDGEATKEEIQAFAKENFGDYGGYAQQYLFVFARGNA